jgi:glutamine amidotransferase
MCELFAMSSRKPASVAFSLEEFARHGGRSGPNKDGWGIAYHQERDAWVIKETVPASSSDLMQFIECHHLRSTLVISHIRRATRGGICFENTQPYCRELGGRAHLFAHNGDLVDVDSSAELQIGRIRPMGTTDSEYAFCVLLRLLEHLWLGSPEIPKLEDRIEIVSSFASVIRTLGPANFLYWDGDALFAHAHQRRHDGEVGFRTPALYTLCRTCSSEPSAPSTKGVSVVPEPGEQRVVLVASVPLTDEDWQPLDEGEIVVVSNGTSVTRVTP